MKFCLLNDKLFHIYIFVLFYTLKITLYKFVLFRLLTKLFISNIKLNFSSLIKLSIAFEKVFFH